MAARVLDKITHEFNADDLIGSVKLKFTSQQGKIVANWSQIGMSKSPEILKTQKGEAKHFTLTGEGATYLIDLLLFEKGNENHEKAAK